LPIEKLLIDLRWIEPGVVPHGGTAYVVWWRAPAVSNAPRKPAKDRD
jgi:hypothetical protein